MEKIKKILGKIGICLDSENDLNESLKRRKKSCKRRSRRKERKEGEKEMKDINSTIIELYLPKPKCLLYEPVSEEEGICNLDLSIVNIDAGCQNPENCIRYKNQRRGLENA